MQAVDRILVHLQSTASYPQSHTFGVIQPIWTGTIFTVDKLGVDESGVDEPGTHRRIGMIENKMAASINVLCIKRLILRCRWVARKNK